MTDKDTEDLLKEKSEELTLAENDLNIVEESKESIVKKIVLMRIEIDEIRIKIRRDEIEADKFNDPIRKAKNNLSKKRRECKALERRYFREQRGI